MATVEALRHQVASIRAKIGRPGDPKHFIFEMPEGADIPACIKSQMGPYDTVVIVEVMPEYFSGIWDEPGCCCVITTHGNFTVSMETGEWTKVMQPVTHARRR